MNPGQKWRATPFAGYWLVESSFQVRSLPDRAQATVLFSGGSARAQASGGRAVLPQLKGKKLRFGSMLTISVRHPRYFPCTIKEKLLRSRDEPYRIVSKNC